MSGTTPSGDLGPDGPQDPFQQPTGQPSRRFPWRDNKWRDAQPFTWETGDTAGGSSTGPPPTPRPILTAAKLMYVGVGLSLLTGILTLLNRDAIREAAVGQNQQDLTAAELDSFVDSYIVFSTVIALLSVALWLWMAWANKKGYSWARIVATILGGLNIMFGLWGLTAGGFNVGSLTSLISPVLAAVILYLLYRPESSEFYRRMARKPHA